LARFLGGFETHDGSVIVRGGLGLSVPNSNRFPTAVSVEDLTFQHGGFVETCPDFPSPPQGQGLSDDFLFFPLR